MRIATNTLYDRGLAAIDSAQRDLSRAQQQVATGHRVNSASDDPVASTEILRTTSLLANNTQYVANQAAAASTLKQTDSTLGQVGDLLQSVRTTLISANSSALSDSDRVALSTELKSRLDALISLANTQDGNGHFLFSGYQATTTPFARTSTSVTYAGDDGSRKIQVSAARQLDSTVNGADVFTRLSTGNGVFAPKAASTNTGTGIVDTGKVVDATLLTGHGYQVQFSVTGTTTTYQVLDTTTNTLVAAPATTGNAFTPGTAITVAGQQFTISGSPSNSDKFDVTPAARQSVFATLQAAADLLAVPTNGAAGVAKAASGILAGISNIDSALDHVLSVRASVGVRQNELDALGATADSIDVDGQSRLSDLRDTDYAKAIAELSKRQTALDAAQKTFALVSSKTLFDYL